MLHNITSIKTSSDGAWQGDNPFNYAFPLLIIQTTLVLFVSRFIAFLLKPLRQPKVIAEMIGGILLGPSAFSRNKNFKDLAFPSWSIPILESVASIGLLFFLFLVGLELDLTSIRRSGKRAFTIALAGISLPFLLAVGITFLLQKVIHVNNNVGYVQFLMFIAVSLSVTAFPVLARILAELKLFTTQVGETAMAAAAFNDVAAWILLALAVALASGGHKSPLISIWVLISGIVFVVFMLLLIRPMMNWVASKLSKEHEVVDEAFICLTLAGVMLSGFMTDLIGIHSIFGGFVFGLTIPKKGDFADRLIKRIEDFVSCLLLPLYFASSGLKTDVTQLHGVEAWGLLVLVISVACAGKIFGTFFVAILWMIPVRESLTLGVLMNTKGLVELIVLNIGKEKKILNDEMFTVLVLMALFTTFLTTPTVMAIYKPARRQGLSSQTHHHQLQRQLQPLTDLHQELRILACVYGPGNVPSLINLIESIRTTNSPIKLYIVQLVELTDRSSSILMVQRNRKNGFPLINRCRKDGMHNDQIAAAFEAYGQVGRISVRHSTAISTLSTMHEDICYVAEDKKVAVIILPFHKQQSGVDGEAIEENMGQGWREVNKRVMNTATCSVAVLVNREFELVADPTSTMPRRVCILFFGGPDDRKVLELGSRMVEHPAVMLTLLRLSGNSEADDAELDEVAITEFKMKWQGSVNYVEKEANKITEEVISMAKGKAFELLIVGKGSYASTMVANLTDFQAEHTELGTIGDLLSSADLNITSSVLVIQTQELAKSNKTTVLKMTRNNKAVIKEVIRDSGSSV
ncbi:Cation/H(+) antiporter like [Quillaja saponaria]|uniref:Cation/H(+) antiporter like n=1 Tax=Quillaja saponaria TaxID=32244 RepID=A0AAD7VE58_QUISA|nr:Cation/H(+) antiporter like [Quillaja saponaria]